MKMRLLGKTPDELKEIAVEAGLPAFAGKQMAQWLYQKRVRSIEEMTNLSKQGREALAQRYEVGLIEPIDVQTSQDGTKKYLFPHQDLDFEAVMIPDEDRRTLCVSSQAGCKMGCKFCMTGRQGFHGNLEPAQILSQYFAIEEAGELTNTVFMGMGEPLDNWETVKRVIDILTAPWGLAWSPKRITLSTIGVLPNLKRYLDESRCHLAVSLHNPFPDERAALGRDESYTISSVGLNTDRADALLSQTKFDVLILMATAPSPLITAHLPHTTATRLILQITLL